MKVAIVAPCPIPYMVGGAEKLWSGLAAHLNEHTRHQAEIIKLPAPESDLASLIRGYQAFSTLDLADFDVVISGKYPAWMVAHPRHVCYMLHRLRGLYDCYPGEPEVPRRVAGHAGVAALRAFMRRYPGARTALPEFFGRWNEIMARDGKPPGLLDFPGPLARELVHWLDAIALAPEAIAIHAAISATVANRPGYFPPGVDVAVAHPPSHRTMPPGEGADHFYSVSRLDVPKRVALLVEAMRKVRTDVPLIIGGTGPEEARLREQAAGDPRIRFAGFQSDAEVRDGYRNALAVPFVPFDEDYGLIAAEAMQCAKPVITTRDAGGVCELVEDGITGLVCEATADALAAAMQRLVDDRGLAASLGRKGLERAARITWSAVAETLLAEPPTRRSSPAAPARKLVVASTFAIFPPRNGGASRSFHLYRTLAPEFETVIVSLGTADEPAFEATIAPGVREVRIPMSAEHERREKRIEAEVGTPVRDVLMPELHSLTPALREAIVREARGACAAVASHPYLHSLLEPLGLPIWYEAQDFELHIKQSLFEGRPRGRELVDAVRASERACATAAEVILCASPVDADQLVEVYAVERERILDVPNGTDAQFLSHSGPAERAALRERLGLRERGLVLFMGSGHWPNIEAAKRVMEYSARMPDVAFMLVGNVCYAFDPAFRPSNVLFVGEVDDITRKLCLDLCDVAVNPMEHGSGTNIKMLDYFAAGLPVVTTERGARGLRLEGEAQCLVRSIEDVPAAIREVLGEGAAAAAGRARAARELVEREFDWEAIGRRIKPRLVALADGHRAAARSAETKRVAR